MRKVILAVLMMTTISTAYSKNWETDTHNGVTVKSKVTTENDKTIISYVATKTVDANIKQVEALMRKPSEYKNFLENTEESREIKKKSDNSWLTYMYFDAPWPLPNSDCVQEWTYEKIENGFVLTGKAVKGAYPKKDVDRMYQSNAKYEFTQVEEGKVRLTLSSDFAPIGSVPNWLIRQWFPKGPANIVNRLFENAKN